jgi:hypothetical protein
VGEMPETKSEEQRVFWYHFTPAAICILGAIALTFVPGWMPVLRDASASLVNQKAYLHTVYTGRNIALTLGAWNEAIPEASVRGSVGLLFAILLACTSVFRSKLRRVLRAGAYLEGGLPGMRAAQSGHFGDYVLWITVGLATFGLAAMVLLRA